MHTPDTYKRHMRLMGYTLMCVTVLSGLTISCSSTNGASIVKSGSSATYDILVHDTVSYAYADSDLEIDVRYSNPGYDPPNLCLELMTNSSRGRTPTVQAWDLPLCASRDSSCTARIDVHIPADAAWAEFAIVSDSGVVDFGATRQLPVVQSRSRDDLPSGTSTGTPSRADTKTFAGTIPQRNASLFAHISGYSHDTTGTYLELERQWHPDNEPMTTLVEWGSRITPHGPDTAAIRRDMQRLDTLPDSPGKVLAQFIGHALVVDSTTTDSLWCVVRDRDLSYELNHPLITGPMKAAIHIADRIAPVSYSRRAHLCSTYPLSEYTWSVIRSGGYKKMADSVTTSVYRERLGLKREMRTVRVLLSTCLENPILTSREEVEQLAAELYENVSEFDAERLERDRHRSTGGIARPMFLIEAAKGFHHIGNEQKSREILLEVVNAVPPSQANGAVARMTLARQYAKSGDTARALQHLRTAYHGTSHIRYLHDTIYGTVATLTETPQAALTTAGPDRSGLQQLEEDAPDVVKSDTTIALLNPPSDVQLEFFSISCGPCLVHLRTLSEQQAAGELEHVDIVIVSRNSESDVRGALDRIGLRADLAKNIDELWTYFGIRGFPVTIRVSNNGRILYRIDGTTPK